MRRTPCGSFPPARLSKCATVYGAYHFVSTWKNELTGARGFAAAVVAQAAVDYLGAEGEEWRTAEEFLKSEDCRRIVEACGAEYCWPCEGLERFRRW